MPNAKRSKRSNAARKAGKGMTNGSSKPQGSSKLTTTLHGKYISTFNVTPNSSKKVDIAPML